MPDADDLRMQVARLTAEVGALRERVRALESGGGHSPEPESAERRFGAATVNRIGAFTLAIGIIFFFRYAADNDWIGARGRVAAGLLCGAALASAAEWLNRRAQKLVAQGLCGCGIAALYISLYAAFAYYKLVPESLAFAALVAVCSLAVALSLRYGSAAIAALGCLGGVLTPVLLHAGQAAGADALYFIAIELTCVLLAARRSWKQLPPLVAVATVTSGWILFRLSAGAGDTQVFELLVFGLAAMHLAAWRWAAGPVRNVFYLVASGCFVAGSLSELHRWAEANIAAPQRGSAMSELSSLFLGVYGVAALVYSVVRGSDVNRRLALALLAFTIAKLYLWDVWFLDRVYRTTAFAGLGAILLGASWIYSRVKTRV